MEKTSKTAKPGEKKKAAKPRAVVDLAEPASKKVPAVKPGASILDEIDALVSGEAAKGRETSGEAGGEGVEEETIRGDVASLSAKWLKRPVGRPSEYRPDFCEIVTAMGAAGFSKAQIAYELNVVKNTLNSWSEAHPEFLTAMEHAREMSQGWWENQGQAGIWGGKQFSAQAYNLQVRNRFPDDWKERSALAITGADGGAIKTDSLTKVIAANEDFDEFRRLAAERQAKSDTQK
jgi:hypothetical protein